MNEIAYNEGYIALKGGASIEDNPYPVSKTLIQSESYNSWKAGYIDADNRESRRLGQHS